MFQYEFYIFRLLVWVAYKSLYNSAFMLGHYYEFKHFQTKTLEKGMLKIHKLLPNDVFFIIQKPYKITYKIHTYKVS
jgi:hypothetical protein